MFEPLPFFRKRHSEYIHDYSDPSVEESMLISELSANNLGLSVTVDLEANITDPMLSNAVPLVDQLTLNVTVSSLQLHADVLALILQENIVALTGASFQKPKELLGILHSLNVTFVKLNFTLENFSMRSVHLDWEKGFANLVDDVIRVSARKIAPSVVNALLGSQGRDYANQMINKFIEENHSSVQLSSSMNDDDALLRHPETLGVNVYWTIVGAIMMTVLFILVSVVSVMMYKTKEVSNTDDGLISLSVQEDDGLVVNNVGIGMIQHPHLHSTTRYGVLALLLFNIFLYISAHSSMTADFRIIFTVDERTFIFPTTYEYNIINNIINMYKAGIGWVSFIIIVAIGFVPYAKLTFLTCAWVLPRKNEYLLKLVTISNDLAKWSFTDLFITSILAEVLHFKASSPAGERVQKDSVKIEAFLIPEWGLYVYLFASILAAVMNHVVLRKYVVVHARGTEGNGGVILDANQSVHHLFKNSGRSYRQKISLAFNVLIIVSIIMMGVGTILPSFMFKSEGIYGAFMDSIGENTLLDMSLWSHIVNIPKNSVNPHRWTIFFIQIVYGFMMTIPFLFLISLLVVWFAPLSSRMQHRLSWFVHLKSAWTGIEVFTLTAVIAIFAVRPFSAYMVAPQCEPYQPIFDVLFNGMRCYDVVPYFGKWSPVILVGSFVFFVVAKILLVIMGRMFGTRDSGTEPYQKPYYQPIRLDS